MNGRSMAAGAAAVVALTGAVVAPSSAANPTGTTALRDAVTVDGIMEHLEAFQAIADANDGTRASGTPGYDASADYVADRLTAAGYSVTVQPFLFDLWVETAPPVFERTSAPPRTYVEGDDFATMEYSDSGDVTGTVVPTNDLVLPPASAANTSNSGCEPTDFATASSTETQVALVQRGTCDFAVKAANAEAAGYDAVVIFNEGQEGRTDAIAGTLGGDVVDVPVLGTSFEVGDELAAMPGAVVHITTATSLTEDVPTVNVLADTAGGRADRTVVVGAHLDSVAEGPGINDNGSGTATILEIAEEIAEMGIEPTNRIRFAFWGAEEVGLVGAEHYVSSLTARQRKDIALNLNFDMVASPNYVRFVYDGDGSDTPTAGPTGSAAIERVFLEHFASAGLETEPTAFDGRSDYGPFIAVGIPAGGLFSGAEGVKTAEQAAIYGGAAGEPYDPCYHQACDDITNLNTDSLGELSDGAAHAVLTFAMSQSSVSGTGRGSGTPTSGDGHTAAA